MRYFSTRGAGPVSLDEALKSGIASDGGLYLPEQLPAFEPADFSHANTIPEVARVLLSPYFEASLLEDEIDAILAETFSFPIPVTAVASLPVNVGTMYSLPPAVD